MRTLSLDELLGGPTNHAGEHIAAIVEVLGDEGDGSRERSFSHRGRIVEGGDRTYACVSCSSVPSPTDFGI